MKESSMRNFIGELLTCEPELITPDIQALDEEVIYVSIACPMPKTVVAVMVVMPIGATHARHVVVPTRGIAFRMCQRQGQYNQNISPVRGASRDVRLALSYGVEHLSMLALSPKFLAGNVESPLLEDKGCAAWTRMGPMGKVQSLASTAAVPVLAMGWSTAAEGDEVTRRAAVLHNLALALAPILPDACARIVADCALFLAAPPLGPPAADIALNQDGCRPNGLDPDPSSSDGDSLTDSGELRPNTQRQLSLADGGGGVRGKEGMQTPHGEQTAREELSARVSTGPSGSGGISSEGDAAMDKPQKVQGGNGSGESLGKQLKALQASGSGGIFPEGDAGMEKPRRMQGGNGSGESLASLSEGLQMNLLTLRFASRSMEAAYVARSHAKLLVVDLKLLLMKLALVIVYMLKHAEWLQGSFLNFPLMIFNGFVTPLCMGWLAYMGPPVWYLRHRELLINITTYLTLLLVGMLQVTVPPTILAGTAKAEGFSLMMMYWSPLAVFIQNLFFRVRFSKSATSRAIWLVLYFLYVAPHATVCTPRLQPTLSSPTSCWVTTTTLMLASVAGPVLINRWCEVSDRRDFARQTLHGRTALQGRS